MMTVMETANRIVRRLRAANVTDLPLSEAADVAAAMNQALAEVHQLLPSVHRRALRSYVLPGLRTVTAHVTHGSATVQNGTFTEAEAAARVSVQVTGDGSLNRARATNALLDAYAGATGDSLFTIYNDAVALEPDVERVVGTVTFVTDTGSVQPLDMVDFGSYPFAHSYVPQGMPRACQLEFLSGVEAPDRQARCSLRVWPAPSTLTRVRVAVELALTTLRAEDVTGTQRISLADAFVESGVIPLACEALTSGYGTSWGANSPMAEMMRVDAARARTFLASSPRTVIPQIVRIGERRGW